MDLFLIAAAIYLVIGAIKAISHINSGRVGTEGVLVTFLFVTVAWPIVGRRQ